MIRIDFTKKQFERFKEVSEHFEKFDLYLVSDGFVTAYNQKVWWHSVEGPYEVNVADDIKNIKEYPEYYSIQEPEAVVQYESLFIEE